MPTQYDHREGSEGLESHIRRSARFFLPRRLLILRRGAAYQQSGPTTSDMAERFTGPCSECMEWLGEMGPSADDVCSCFAGCTLPSLTFETILGKRLYVHLQLVMVAPIAPTHPGRSYEHYRHQFSAQVKHLVHVLSTRFVGRPPFPVPAVAACVQDALSTLSPRHQALPRVRHRHHDRRGDVGDRPAGCGTTAPAAVAGAAAAAGPPPWHRGHRGGDGGGGDGGGSSK